MVYFIRTKDSGNIKIGYSMNPAKRKADLQTAHHEELEFIGIMDGSLDDEARLQERFSKFNIRGEWYRPDPEILDFIEQHKKPRKNIVTSLGYGKYRITFVEPLKFTMKFFLLAGSFNMEILGDDEAKFVFGVEGERYILLSWLKSLNGVTKEAIENFASLMID